MEELTAEVFPLAEAESALRIGKDNPQVRPRRARSVGRLAKEYRFGNDR